MPVVFTYDAVYYTLTLRNTYRATDYAAVSPFALFSFLRVIDVFVYA